MEFQTIRRCVALFLILSHTFLIHLLTTQLQYLQVKDSMIGEKLYLLSQSLTCKILMILITLLETGVDMKHEL